MNKHSIARRSLLVAGLGSVAACGPREETAAGANSTERHAWRMVTSWPPNFPGFGASANRLAERIQTLSDGRLDIEVFAAGELLPAFEVFDAVSRGQMQMAHSSPTYWRGIVPSAPIFSSVPFGMLAQEHNTWLLHGGGLQLWREVYGEHGVVPFVAGNTGAQMGGWFNREIRSLEDIQGLRMRISGLGGEVFQRTGGVPVSLPGAELFTSLTTGAIDATEWNGPFNDMAFGLHEAASYYYYPGWHEPSGNLECLISADAWAALSPFLKTVIETACLAETQFVMTEFAARNLQALVTLRDEHGIEPRRFPDAVLSELQRNAQLVMQDLADGDATVARVWESYSQYAEAVGGWLDISNGYFRGA